MAGFLNWLDALYQYVTGLLQTFLEKPDVIETLVAIAVGGIIAWLVSRRYYKKAGDELRQEAESLRNKSEELRKLQELTIYALTNASERLKFIRDSAGNVGLDQSSAGQTKFRTAASGEMTIEPKPHPKGPEAGS
jgi:hypothetical protein